VFSCSKYSNSHAPNEVLLALHMQGLCYCPPFIMDIWMSQISLLEDQWELGQALSYDGSSAQILFSVCDEISHMLSVRMQAR
jgi:hypothetical protein